MKSLQPKLIVLEATGGLEKNALRELVKANLNVSIVNPKRIRDFAKASGKSAKTDKIDSSVISHFGEVFSPINYNQKDLELDEIKELLARKNQLQSMILSEGNRLLRVSVKVSKLINKHIEWLEKEFKSLEKEIANLIKENSDLAFKKDILESVPGIGEIVSTVLISELPELGNVNNKSISSLIGVAPVCNDSGKFRGKRRIAAGRNGIRKVLYMSAITASRFNPVIRDFYTKLLSSGKPKKLALVACMRKLITILNSMLKNKTKWGENMSIIT